MSRLCVCVTWSLAHHCCPAGLSILEHVGEGDAETKTVPASWWRHVCGYVQSSTSLNCNLTTQDPAPKICSITMPAHFWPIVPHV